MDYEEYIRDYNGIWDHDIFYVGKRKDLKITEFFVNSEPNDQCVLGFENRSVNG